MADGAINSDGKNNAEPLEANFAELHLNDLLDKICRSERFVRSGRAQDLLHYLVNKSCAGRSVELKERTIGIDVFGRSPDYDTSNDAIVRVAANDLRKRLTAFYQDGLRDGEVFIEIPPGSYVPHFRTSISRSTDAEISNFETEAGKEHPPHESAALVEPSRPFEMPKLDAEDYANSSRTTKVWLQTLLSRIVTAARADWRRTVGLSGFLLFVLAVAVFSGGKVQEYLVARYVHPSILNTLVDKQHRVLLCVGEQNDEYKDFANRRLATIRQANQSMGQVSLEYALGISQLTNSIVGNGYEYIVLPSDGATFAVLKHNVIVSLGGLNNIWTIRFTEHLRFHFVLPEPSSESQLGDIVDSKVPGRVWSIDFNAPVSQYTKDYAIVAKFHDPMLNQEVLVAAGIGKAGTLAAANMATNPSFRERLGRQIQKMQIHNFENFEAVISTAVVDGRPTHSEIEAIETW